MVFVVVIVCGFVCFFFFIQRRYIVLDSLPDQRNLKEEFFLKNQAA